MHDPVSGFLKVSTIDGRTFYINPHHVTAVEVADGGTSVLLHNGEKVLLAAKAEEILQAVHDLQSTPGAPERRLRQRQRGRPA